VSATH